MKDRSQGHSINAMPVKKRLLFIRSDKMHISLDISIKKE